MSVKQKKTRFSFMRMKNEFFSKNIKSKSSKNHFTTIKLFASSKIVISTASVKMSA
jgi:hypothetical protein